MTGRASLNLGSETSTSPVAGEPSHVTTGGSAVGWLSDAVGAGSWSIRTAAVLIASRLDSVSVHETGEFPVLPRTSPAF